MPSRSPPPGSADEGLGRIDRGQRVRGEVRLELGHDGKERANFAPPKVGDLAPDEDTESEPTPVTVENVVHVADSASVWEALEEDEG